jgi:outer membrane protein
MKTRNSILFAFILLLSGNLHAQQKTWSLKECIEYGLKNHGSVRISENQKQTADQQARQALSTYLPQVNGSGTLDNNLKLQKQVIPGGIFGPEPVSVAFGTRYASVLSAQLEQTIFDQSLLIGLKANKPNIALAELNATQTEETLIYNITQAFYQIQISKAQLALLQNNKEMYSKLVPIMQLQVDKGVVTKVELDKVNVNLNNTESTIISTENTIRQAYNSLKYNMGMQDNSADMEILDKEVQPGQTAVANSLANFDYKLQTSYKIQQSNMLLQQIDAQRIRAGALPKLSFYLRYGSQALNNDLGSLYGKMNDFAGMGLKLTVPIFDGFNRNSQYKQAVIKVNTALENMKLNEASIRLQFDNAKTQLTQTQLTLENNKRNIELAQTVFNTTTLQYQKGVNTLTDMLNAEQSLKEAQNTFINNLLKNYQARLDIEKANGTLTQFYKELE